MCSGFPVSLSVYSSLHAAGKNIKKENSIYLNPWVIKALN